jgi:hypothetical protein
MANIDLRASVSVTVQFTISEEEARALDALVGYGDDSFIKEYEDHFFKIFYTRLGEHYMKPHEKGLRKFFQSIRDIMPGLLSRTDKARKTFNGEEGK